MLPIAASAQQPTLPERISGPTRVALERLIDSASAAGIPREPLYDKASEGVLKGANTDQVVRAVRNLVARLGEAQTALGVSADRSLLGAGVSALMAGVSPAELKRLAHPPGAQPNPSTLSMALVTLVDLVANRVPLPTATSSIQNLIDHRATERQFSTLRSDVERDILAGTEPEASLAHRVRIQLGSPTP